MSSTSGIGKEILWLSLSLIAIGLFKCNLGVFWLGDGFSSLNDQIDDEFPFGVADFLTFFITLFNSPVR